MVFVSYLHGVPMSYLVNHSADFVQEMITGFVAANCGQIRQTPGGVIRANQTPAGEVAVVIGGGSGHYPAFAGLVGPGLAHGAAMGNVFASPSAQQICNVAKAAASDSGVLLSYGNYAGDTLNFGIAEERLRAEGIPCRCLAVTDDICSGPENNPIERRGIAGDLTVFRAASWAAECGYSLDAVYDFAYHANSRTRSFGVAFSGCTLPGAIEPLFTIPKGRMGVGMGIHGEHGISEVDLPSAHELGQMLVDRLLEERPANVKDTGSPRVAVLLNGLGSVKYEELFVLYGSVAKRLTNAGLKIIAPEVGELVTSFEMAGLSLTLFWLDEDLERAWTSPVNTPAYRRNRFPQKGVPRNEFSNTAETNEEAPEASHASKTGATCVLTVIEAIKTMIDEQAKMLGDLDAISGDGDHGFGMQIGTTAALNAARLAVENDCGAGTVLTRAGDAWANDAGGTSGALWGLGLRSVGIVIGDRKPITAQTTTRAVNEATDAILRLGGAKAGDKTLIDSLQPFAETLSSRVKAGMSLCDAWKKAAERARECAEATAQLTPRAGRAKNHADRSVGHPDPGAISLAMVVMTIATTLEFLHENEI